MSVPDSPATVSRLGRHGGSHGPAGYPQVRLVALVACGTRTILDAVFGPTSTSETGYTRRLLPSLRAGMIVLADRGFGANTLLAEIAGTGAHVLVRLKSNRVLPVLARYPDGSYLS
ncbi:MAG: transposase, partial [Sciscionella sp.]